MPRSEAVGVCVEVEERERTVHSSSRADKDFLSLGGG